MRVKKSSPINPAWPAWRARLPTDQLRDGSLLFGACPLDKCPRMLETARATDQTLQLYGVDVTEFGIRSMKMKATGRGLRLLVPEKYEFLFWSQRDGSPSVFTLDRAGTIRPGGAVKRSSPSTPPRPLEGWNVDLDEAADLVLESGGEYQQAWIFDLTMQSVAGKWQPVWGTPYRWGNFGACVNARTGELLAREGDSLTPGPQREFPRRTVGGAGAKLVTAAGLMLEAHKRKNPPETAANTVIELTVTNPTDRPVVIDTTVYQLANSLGEKQTFGIAGTLDMNTLEEKNEVVPANGTISIPLPNDAHASRDGKALDKPPEKVVVLLLLADGTRAGPCTWLLAER